MANQMKKTLELPLPDGETLTMEVTFRIIEIVERVYQKNADMVVSVDLASPIHMLRSKIADVISEWVATRQTNFKRSEIREFVITRQPMDLNVYAGCIQAAVMYSLKYIDDDQFAKLTRGEDLDEPTPKKESKRGKGKAPAASSKSATE